MTTVSANPISWTNLTEAIEFYSRLGYLKIEAPWVVTKGVWDFTSPAGKAGYWVGDRLLVASAEQSFIEMLGNGDLGLGKYQALTPCFRDDSYDVYRKPYFMKLELIEVLALDKLTRISEVQTNSKTLGILGDATGFFQRKLSVETIETNENDPLRASKSFDILGRGIELGSYGSRRLPSGIHWVYGTGCAEPRLSTVMRS